MNIYSYKAECAGDTCVFEVYLRQAGIEATLLKEPEYGIPEILVEIHTDASLEELIAVAEEAPNCHVIERTLKACPLDENDFKGRE